MSEGAITSHKIWHIGDKNKALNLYTVGERLEPFKNDTNCRLSSLERTITFVIDCTCELVVYQR